MLYFISPPAGVPLNKGLHLHSFCVGGTGKASKKSAKLNDEPLGFKYVKAKVYIVACKYITLHINIQTSLCATDLICMISDLDASDS